MRKIFILRAILQFILFFSVMGGIVLFIMTPVILFSSKFDTPIKISGNYLEINSVEAKIVLVIGSIAYLLYVYAIFLLKKTIDLFIKNNLFDDGVIKKLKSIGMVFIIVALITDIPMFFYEVFVNHDFILNLTAYDSDSTLFNIAIGLFFMILSEVFKIAKTQKEENIILKEENELTI